MCKTIFQWKLFYIGYYTGSCLVRLDILISFWWQCFYCVPTTAVQSVVEPCNIAIYIYSYMLYICTPKSYIFTRYLVCHVINIYLSTWSVNLDCSWWGMLFVVCYKLFFVPFSFLCELFRKNSFKYLRMYIYLHICICLQFETTQKMVIQCASVPLVN